MRFVFGEVQYALQSLKLLDVYLQLVRPKIPDKVEKYVPLGVVGWYLLTVFYLVVIPLFLPEVNWHIRSFFWDLPSFIRPLINTVIVISWLLPAGAVVPFYLWRKRREKNQDEVQKSFLEERKTVILKPRGDDKNQWRNTYEQFWGNIHRNFAAGEKDVLEQNLPFASFEVLRFGPWLTKNSRPDYFLSITAPVKMLSSILTQLQSIHNDMIIDYPDDDLISNLQNEENSQIYYEDYTVSGEVTRLLATDTATDRFRMLSTVMREIPTGIYSAGVQLLVRDALNLYSALDKRVQDLLIDPETQKRKSLSDNEKMMVKDLENKKKYAQQSLTYDIVIRLFAVGSDTDAVKKMVSDMSEWLDALRGDNTFEKIAEGDDFVAVAERRYPSKMRGMNSVSPAELKNIWHIPDVQDGIPLLLRAGFRMIPPPQNTIIREGEKARPIGYYPTTNGEKLTIGLRQTGRNPDIFYHTYIVGPTGVGKSVCLQNMIVADMNCIHEPTGKPYSVIVLEPHDDLTTDVLKRVPDHREKDIILIDPLDRWPIGMNLMETSGNLEDVEADAYTVLSIFAKAMGSAWDQAVRMQRMMGNAVQAIMRVLPRRGETPTVLHLQAFLSNSNYRKYVVDGLTADDGILMNEWSNFLAKSDNEQSNILDPAITRINRFLNNQILRRVISQPKNSLNFSQLMDNGTILLAKMNTRMGDDNRSLVGGMIVSQVFKAAMSRGNRDITLRQPTGFFIDEFQTMVAGTGKEIEAILAEARKMRLGLTMANQFFNQLPSDVQNAVANNTGTKIIFRCEPQDARLFEPIFQGKLSTSDFIGLQRYMAHLRIMSKENPEIVTVYTFPPPPIPDEKKIQKNNRDLYADTARKMGITLLDDLGGDFNSDKKLLGYMMRFDLDAHSDPKLHTSLVKILTNVSDRVFADYQKLRKTWCEIQRDLLLRDPGYIPQKRERVEHLSRLRVGLPTYETDALLGRLNQQIQRITEENEEKDAAGVDADYFELGGGSRSSSKKKTKKNEVDLDVFNL